MGKLDKVLETTAPVAKAAAKESAKLTGKGLVLAGKGIKVAGGKALDNYKEQRVNQIDNRFQELEEQYPGGVIFSVYNPDHVGDRKKLTSRGLKHYAKDPYGFNILKAAKVIVDQNNNVQYTLHGNYDTTLKRVFTVYAQGKIIGIVNEHSKWFSHSYETIKCGVHTLGKLFDNYTFSDPRITIERKGLLTGHFVVRDAQKTIMELGSVRGQEYIAIVNSSIMNECILLYTGIDLIRNPKPSGGGGDGGDGGE